MYPAYSRAQLDWSALELYVLRIWQMVDGGVEVMFRPSNVTPKRMTCCAIGGSLYQPFIFHPDSRCNAMTRKKASTFLRYVATSLMTPVSPE